MDKLSHLRDSARHCRETAAQTGSAIVVQQLLKLATDIEQLIAEMERRAGIFSEHRSMPQESELDSSRSV
jgi:hypothetical protein